MLCFPKTCDVLAVFIQMWAERCSAKQNEYPSTDGTTPPQYLWRLHNLLAACLISCIWSVSNSSCWGGGLKFAANKMHLEVRRISATKKTKTGHPRREQAGVERGAARHLDAFCQVWEPLPLASASLEQLGDLALPSPGPAQASHRSRCCRETHGGERKNKAACRNNFQKN